MRYEVKRTKIEEIVIDLEDGCVLKLRADNLISLDVNRFSGVTFTTIDMVFTTGLSYGFKTSDEALISHVHELMGVIKNG